MPSSVSRSISSRGALVMVARLVPSAKVIGTSTPTARSERTVRRGADSGGGVMRAASLRIVGLDYQFTPAGPVPAAAASGKTHEIKDLRGPRRGARQHPVFF